MNAEQTDLAQVIEKLHGCAPAFNCEHYVHESFRGETVWEGHVCEFDVQHPKTRTCFAWSYLDLETQKQKYYTVLAIPPVTEPVHAVRVAIRMEAQEKN